MKKLLFLAIATIAIGCGKTESESIDPSPENPEQNPIEQSEMVTVSFAMTGEYTIEERPLSRADGVETPSSDMYGINIYYDVNKDGHIDTPYGYGLFDNVEDIKAALLSGHKYKFVCTVVIDGKNKLKCWSDKSYGDPFYRTTSLGSTKIENRFIIGDNSAFSGLGSGSATMGDGDYYGWHFYPVDRYYGELTDYEPTADGVVSIDLKRCVFGIQFDISGITDGSVEISGNVRPKRVTEDTTLDEMICSFEYIKECWENTLSTDDYSEKLEIWILWHRGNGITQYFEDNIMVKRNVMTEVRIQLKGNTINNGMEMTFENSEDMGRENVDIIIDADGIVDTPVDSQK